MKTYSRQLFYSFLTTALFFLFTSVNFTAKAQSPWLPDSLDNGIGFEFLKPVFDDGTGISALTSTQIISGRYRANDNVLLVVELPFIYFNSDFFDSEFKIGNPYVGFLVNNSSKTYFLEAGIRAPLASDDDFGVTSIGVFSDFDRAEAYGPDLFAITVKNNYLKKSQSGFVFKLMGGLSYWLSTDSNNTDSELLFDYSGHAGYDGDKVQLLGGITGRLIITEDDIDFGERTFHQFGIIARYKATKVQPGLLFRIPLDDDLGDLINFVAGVNLLINL